MKKFYFALSLVLILFTLAACEAEFSPEGDYSEQMMVYCLLDKNSDTTFVRIERCFLGKGNAVEYASNKDSIYYQDGDLDVKLYAYTLNDTNNAKKTFSFSYTTREKNNGTFYSNGSSPIYYCVTKNELQNYTFYKLVIKNLRTGLTVSSSTYMVNEFEVTSSDLRFQVANANSPNHLDDFKDIHWTGYSNNSASELNKAKFFQMDIVFYYGKDGTNVVDSVSMPIMSRAVSGTTQQDNSIRVTINDLILKIKEELNKKGQTKIKPTATHNFVIKVYGSNKDMADYMSANNAAQTSLNYKPMYSNIRNGYGLFASRNIASKVINQSNVSSSFWIELKKVITIVE